MMMSAIDRQAEEGWWPFRPGARGGVNMKTLMDKPTGKTREDVERAYQEAFKLTMKDWKQILEFDPSALDVIQGKEPMKALTEAGMYGENRGYTRYINMIFKKRMEEILKDLDADKIPDFYKMRFQKSKMEFLKTLEAMALKRGSLAMPSAGGPWGGEPFGPGEAFGENAPVNIKRAYASAEQKRDKYEKALQILNSAEEKAVGVRTLPSGETIGNLKSILDSRSPGAEVSTSVVAPGYSASTFLPPFEKSREKLFYDISKVKSRKMFSTDVTSQRGKEGKLHQLQPSREVRGIKELLANTGPLIGPNVNELFTRYSDVADNIIGYSTGVGESSNRDYEKKGLVRIKFDPEFSARFRPNLISRIYEAFAGKQRERDAEWRKNNNFSWRISEDEFGKFITNSLRAAAPAYPSAGGPWGGPEFGPAEAFGENAPANIRRTFVPADYPHIRPIYNYPRFEGTDAALQYKSHGDQVKLSLRPLPMGDVEVAYGTKNKELGPDFMTKTYRPFVEMVNAEIVPRLKEIVKEKGRIDLFGEFGGKKDDLVWFDAQLQGHTLPVDQFYKLAKDAGLRTVQESVQREGNPRYHETDI